MQLILQKKLGIVHKAQIKLQNPFLKNDYTKGGRRLIKCYFPFYQVIFSYDVKNLKSEQQYQKLCDKTSGHEKIIIPAPDGRSFNFRLLTIDFG